jgi:hypothetical protein
MVAIQYGSEFSTGINSARQRFSTDNYSVRQRFSIDSARQRFSKTAIQQDSYLVRSNSDRQRFSRGIDSAQQRFNTDSHSVQIQFSITAIQTDGDSIQFNSTRYGFSNSAIHYGAPPGGTGLSQDAGGLISQPRAGKSGVDQGAVDFSGWVGCHRAEWSGLVWTSLDGSYDTQTRVNHHTHTSRIKTAPQIEFSRIPTPFS